MASIWKNRLSLSIFGQSHGPAIGMTLDGLPAGFTLDLEELDRFLLRRAPGRNPWSTTRREEDKPRFLSGLVDQTTCGAPLTAMINNENTRKADYRQLKRIPRPGHADYPAQVKHGGFQDVAGGGHFSGRLTAPLCIAGGIALQILEGQNIRIGAHLAAAGSVKDAAFDPVQDEIGLLGSIGRKDFPVICDQAGAEMKKAIEAARMNRDSLGGIIECKVTGLPAGLGEPIFDGMENRLASLVFAIPGIKGIDFGSGFDGAARHGSENNDAYYYNADMQVKTRTNHHGGILGGMTTGMPLLFKAAVKPTSSIGKKQESIDLANGEKAELEVHGRHDPFIAARAVPCIEAAAAICVLDALLEGGFSL